MSGPKCDFFDLSFEEEEALAKEQQRRIEEETRRRHEKKLEEERRRREEARRRKEEERRRREEERQRKIEEQLRQEKEFDEGVDQIMIELEMQEFLECVSLYEAAADAANTEPLDYEFEPTNWETQKEEINSQIEALKEKAHELDCKERVNEIIVETMEEMGYEVMAERPIDKGVSMARLYKYGDEAALSMIAHDGKFTFEVVATDTKDRVVSENEGIELEEKMHGFCDDYKALMDRLDRDDRLKRREVFHKPADKKYARVVNLSVYNSKTPNEYEKKYGEDYDREISTISRRSNGKGII